MEAHEMVVVPENEEDAEILLEDVTDANAPSYEEKLGNTCGRTWQLYPVSLLAIKGALSLQESTQLKERWEHQCILIKVSILLPTNEGSGPHWSTKPKVPAVPLEHITTAKRVSGKAQLDLVTDPKIRSFEAENQQLRSKLAELRKP
ncbi:hypothetical protein HPB50_017734 [Hyalomma asiaticum]|uniref:Uncharacterized protein n=1 Tax=Hyalomma asiaticum TaxID=266040 RepID=A0ACB7SZN3_HYAAI|nr:hypothetical protein HPB50_017734 [Hyalomma asiaticum]